MGGRSAINAAIRPARAVGITAVLAVLLAGCTSMPDDRFVSLPIPKSTAQTSPREPAAQREHARILASYGGTYENARLQAMIEKTVDRLVAASERPDLKYKVTILNSPAINAFALPNGRLYVTRGLIALANDKAELASVLAHEIKLQGDETVDPTPPRGSCAAGSNAEVEGLITGKDASSITVRQQSKGDYLCQVSGSTRIRKGYTTYTFAQLQSGWRVHVKGTQQGMSGTACQVSASEIMVQQN